jgi:hypothetical protein
MSKQNPVVSVVNKRVTISDEDRETNHHLVLIPVPA